MNRDAMLERHKGYRSQLTNYTAGLNTAPSTIWTELPEEFIDKAIVSFRNRLRSCVAKAGER